MGAIFVNIDKVNEPGGVGGGVGSYGVLKTH